MRQQQITDLSAQIALARANLGDKQAELDRARNVAASNVDILNLPQAVSSPVLTQLRMLELELTQREQLLRAKLGDQHAEVVAVAGRLADIRAQAQNEIANLVVNLQGDYDLALRREHALEADLAKLSTADSTTVAAVRIQDLQRVAEADGKLYDAYLAQYNDIVARQALGRTHERIISSAVVPELPIFPRPLLFYAGAVLLGGAIGLGYPLVREMLRDRMKMGAQAEAAFGYPVIGNVPRQGDTGRLRAARGDARSLIQLAADDPFSPINEAIRSIRLGLQQSMPGSPAKVVMVTSALPNEGKSAIAALLAMSGKAAGQRTVLVDCDIRRRSLSTEFGHAHSPGLTDVLTGAWDLAAVTVRDAKTQCHLVPSGLQVVVPGDMLGSPQMSEVIARLRANYDIVVIDTPPLLAVVDALVLAAQVDRILLVVDGNEGKSEVVSEALRILRPEARRIAGIAFNKVESNHLLRYGYYYGGGSAGQLASPVRAG